MNSIHPIFAAALAPFAPAQTPSVSATREQRLQALEDRLCGPSHEVCEFMQFGGAKPVERAPSLKRIREAMDRRLIVMTEMKAEIDAGAPNRPHPRALDTLRTELAQMRVEYDEADDELRALEAPQSVNAAAE